MLYSTRPLQVKKKMMMRENNMLNAPGALLHSTSIGSPPLLLERRIYRKRENSVFCLCFYGSIADRCGWAGLCPFTASLRRILISLALGL
jgi:hypothetical protein